jgi:hypothetical protein
MATGATRLRGVSRPFYFRKEGIEFAAGLAPVMTNRAIAEARAWRLPHPNQRRLSESRQVP